MVKHRNKRFGESNVPNDLIPGEIAIKTSPTDFLWITNFHAHCSFAVNNLCLVSWKALAVSVVLYRASFMERFLQVWLWMDMQKPAPGKVIKYKSRPGAAVECKTPGVARGDVGAWN